MHKPLKKSHIRAEESTVIRLYALHVANLTSFLGIAYGPPHGLPGAIPESRVRSKS